MTALEDHLRTWLGAWPPAADDGIQVVTAEVRDRPGWDGNVRPLLGVTTPTGGVIGVQPTFHDDVAALLHGRRPDDIDRGLRHRVSALVPGDRTLGRGVFRWTDVAPSTDEHADAGDWVPRDDPRVPAWLRPFNDDHVLIAWDDEGAYGAGVGIKDHDQYGAEVSVVTEPALRGRGLARRLVAQAMRRIVARGQVVTYLHAPDNEASARVATSLGLEDRGWSVWSLFPEE